MSPVKARGRRPVRSGSSSTAAEKRRAKVGAATRSLAAWISIGVGTFILILIVILAAAFWLKRVYASPEQVFWSTMANSLSTSGVTKETLASTSQANRDATKLVFVPEPATQNIQKQTDPSTSPPTTVTVETVSTPKASYRHFLDINRPAAAGQTKLDYSSVYTLWVKSSNNAQTESELFWQRIASAVLFGELQPADRQAVLDYLHSSYQINFANIQKKTTNGRKTYVYNATLNLKNFARAAHKYAASLGLSYANQINPANYKPSDKLPVQITIDVLGHEVSQIDYPTSGLQEKYSGYGISTGLNLPKQVVSVQRLQNQLNSIK